MAVEIAPVLGCATCASPLCPACLGCVSCRTVSAGCVCPSPEFTADRVAARRAWLASERAMTDHLNVCFPCLLEWATDCERGAALRVDEAKALATYKASREGGRP